jgi:hypothetical protein
MFHPDKSIPLRLIKLLWSTELIYTFVLIKLEISSPDREMPAFFFYRGAMFYVGRTLYVYSEFLILLGGSRL